jgi:8-oxo-dGTP diphosphatase
MELNLWEGDRVFLKLLGETEEFFSLKLVYDKDDNLISAIKE